MENYVLEWFIGTQGSRCSCAQRRLLFIWCAGVSTSPLQLLAYRGLSPLKGFWVYVQAYGITLSSVLTAKHDSQEPILGAPEYALSKRQKQTNNSARLLPKWYVWRIVWRFMLYVGYKQTKMSQTSFSLCTFTYETGLFVLVCLNLLYYSIYSPHSLQRQAELL